MAADHSHLLIFAIRYGIFFAIGWGGVLFRRWQKRQRENVAQGWPSVEGLIVSASVVAIPKTTRFEAVLQYAYFVDEYRSGRYRHEFSKEDDADEFARQLKDKRVHIRYKESNPDQSVLEQSVLEQQVALSPRFG